MTKDSFNFIYGDTIGAARAALDPGAFGYYSGGALEQVTVSESAESWKRFRFVAKIPETRGDTSTAVEFAGMELPNPVFISPMACQSLLHVEAESGMAQAAALVNVGYALSTRTSVPIPKVAEAYYDTSAVERLRSQLPLWHQAALEQLGHSGADRRWLPMFQVYQMEDSSISDALVQEAKECGFAAVLLTIDTPTIGIRLNDRRESFSLPDTYPEVVFERMGKGSDGSTEGKSSLFQPRGRINSLSQDKTVGMTAVSHLVGVGGLPVVVKGVSRASDLRAAMEHGAAGGLFSTHGGRQLDRIRSTADSLFAELESSCDPSVAADGGVRTGTDVLTAMCLGASAVGIGRFAAWAFAAGGPVGLACYLIEVLTELRLSLLLIGVDSPNELDRTMLDRQGDR